MKLQPVYRIATLAALTFGLAACGNSDDDPTPPAPQLAERGYSIEITNMTAGQPFSPLVVAAHTNATRFFTVGAAASVPLEQVAEAGDNAPLLAALADDSNVFAEVGGAGILMPGASETVMLDLELMEAQLVDIRISGLTMLVNTNDAITAAQNVDVTNLAVNDSITLTAVVYDAGTEANTETADTMPGPAAAGGAQEGFNAARDDVRDQVHAHAGVVTADDGLSSSVLGAAHRFDNPAMRVVITRTQ